MIYAVVWVICGLLVLSFLWEVVKLVAGPTVGVVLFGGGAALGTYWLAVHANALLCASPWMVDAILWGILPVGCAAYWAATRGRRAAG